MQYSLKAFLVHALYKKCQHILTASAWTPEDSLYLPQRVTLQCYSVVCFSFQDVQQKVRPYILALDMSHFNYDDFIRVLDIVNR